MTAADYAIKLKDNSYRSELLLAARRSTGAGDEIDRHITNALSALHREREAISAVRARSLTDTGSGT